MRIGVTLPALSLLLALATPAGAQVFGQNKVQYEPLSWSVLETQHLQLHYHAQEESLARELVVFAESVCVEYDGRFRLTTRHPIPFLLYSEHHLFQQSNATPEMLSEGTGGLTELIKGRVLLPHTGSWARLRWVTRHELTHAYMLEKLSQVMHEHHRTQGYMPPLWFIEGLAEYCGTTWDADAEGLLRDAVLTNRAEPLTQSDEITGTVLMYKEGQSFLLYLAEHYGPGKIFDLLDDWYRADDFETVFRQTLGVSLAQVDRDWFESLKRRFYPVLANATTPRDVAQRLTLRDGPYNLGPRVLPQRGVSDTAARFCFLSAAEGVADLVLSEGMPNGRRRETHLLRSGVSPSFESFHLFQNRPDTSPSGLIAVVAKRGGRDVLYLVDSHRGKVERKLEFPNLVAIHGPSLLPGDTAAVFSAQDYGGRSDLYRVRWTNDHVRLERLTQDDFDDIEPDASPDGRWVVFASDRADYGGRYAVFRLSLSGGVPEQLGGPPQGDDRQPVYSPDGRWIAFRSTRGGTSDLYVRPAEPSTEVRRVTRLTGPVMDPEWANGGHGLLFTGENAVEFQTYLVRFDPDTLAVEHEAPALHVPVLPQVAYAGHPSHYQRRLGFDLVQTAVAYDASLGASPGGQVALSDVLGNEQFYIAIGNDAERFGNFWDGFEGGVTYLNRARRLNWGLGVFRLTEIYDIDYAAVRREPRAGVLGLVSYPFSRFNRIEGTVTVRHAKDHLLRNGEVRTLDLVSNFVSLVHDDTRWTWMGPSTGSRVFLSAGFTRDLTSSTGDFTTVLGEVRQYMMPVPHVIAAVRFQGQSSQGHDAQHFYVGGGSYLPGYDTRAFSGTQTMLAQGEIRFPLLRGLLLQVPSTWSLPLVGGAVFSDAAWIWNQGFGQRAGSVGAGFYLGGGYYPAIRWNYIWPTENFRDYPRTPRTQFSIAFNF